MDTRNKRLKQILRGLEKEDKLLICTHQHPDGDCIGSQLALYHYLRSLKKKVAMFNKDPVPEILQFLPGWRQIRNTIGTFNPSVVVLLDSGAWSRLGLVTETLQMLPVINLDHHPDNRFKGPLSLVDPSASSVGELLYDMFAVGGRKINSKMAVCLYAAILTDTGSFRQANTSAHTLEVASKLLKEGNLSASVISDAVYNRFELRQLLLMQEMFGTIRLEHKDRLAWGKLTRRMFQRAGAQDEDTEGLINYLRLIKGVKLAAIFRETEQGLVKMNLRSQRGINVLPLVREFGGGGHPSAAGCTVLMTMAKAQRVLLPRLRELVS